MDIEIIMSKVSTDSFILHSRAYKESSLILNLFSKSYGRFSIVAKGIKRKNNQALRAILQPFNYLEIEHVGRGELKTFCNAELKSPSVKFPNRALACGYYINELILRSVEEGQEYSSLFEHYKKIIETLQSSGQYAALLRSFEVQLLTALGIAPQWDLDISGNKINSRSKYEFMLEQGFKLIVQNTLNKSAYSGNHEFDGASILALGSDDFSYTDLKACQRITQLLLRQVIGDKPLQSRKLWV